MINEKDIEIAELINEPSYRSVVLAISDFITSGEFKHITSAAKLFINNTSPTDKRMGPNRYADYRVSTSTPIGDIRISVDPNMASSGGFTVSGKISSDDVPYSVPGALDSLKHWVSNIDSRSPGTTIPGVSLFNIRGLFSDYLVHGEKETEESFLDMFSNSDLYHSFNKSDSGFSFEFSENFFVDINKKVLGEDEPVANKMQLIHRIELKDQTWTYSFHAVFTFKANTVVPDFNDTNLITDFAEKAKNGELAEYVKKFPSKAVSDTGDMHLGIFGREQKPGACISIGPDKSIDIIDTEFSVKVFSELLDEYALNGIYSFIVGSLEEVIPKIEGDIFLSKTRIDFSSDCIEINVTLPNDEQRPPGIVFLFN